MVIVYLPFVIPVKLNSPSLVATVVLDPLLFLNAIVALLTLWSASVVTLPLKVNWLYVTIEKRTGIIVRNKYFILVD
jgi:hypothetical protein